MDPHPGGEATRMEIEAHFLPNLTEPDELAGAAVVVIDVLRATTTIIHALAAGAIDVIPCLEVDEARQIAQRLGKDAALGGERGGVRIDGFHLGNSPDEYTPQKVGGKTVVFTTTNGTRAMRLCSHARRVLIGAFVNFSGLCGALADEPSIHLLCAGTNGEITREDVLLAGAVVDDLSRRAGAAMLLNDQAEIAADAWRSAVRSLTQGALLTEALRSSRGGRNLIEVGHEHDIEIAAAIDKFNLVPKLDLSGWRITL
jgi:2-phosphosulfolactate phosphatase